MTIKERFLNLIGLEAMTNRDLILMELAEMDADALYGALADNKLTRRLDDLKCADCHRLHGGECPCPDNDACALPLEDWLDMPATRERLLEAVL